VDQDLVHEVVRAVDIIREAVVVANHVQDPDQEVDPGKLND